MTDGVTVLFGAVGAVLAVLVPLIRTQGAGRGGADRVDMERITADDT